MPIAISFAFDVQNLLSPVPGPNPVGENLRYEGTYDKITTARREDDATLEQGIWQKDPRRADWMAVSDICTGALAKRSKDLQIAAWLLESWIHLHGFPGAREGLSVLNGLCRNFWGGMYPDLADPEHRAAPFDWINEKLSLQLKFVPLTDPPEASNSRAYCWADWESANHREQLHLQHVVVKSLQNGITPGAFQQALVLSSASFLSMLFDDLNSTIGVARDLEDFLDSKYEKNGPTIRTFRSVLEDIRLMVGRAFTQPQSIEDELPPEEPVDLNAATYGPSSEIPSSPTEGPIRSRAEAYRCLAEAADFLLRTEPHSPTPYLVKRAISWGNLSLGELLPEIIRNENTLGEVLKLLDLKATSNSQEENRRKE
jgi:type VI secretion system protein ImpA